MEWLRWYHGACSDAKCPLIARKSGTCVGVVVSVWAALLEQASQDEERGSIEGFDPETYDVLYGYEDGTCAAVLKAMTEKGLIADGCGVDFAQVVDAYPEGHVAPRGEAARVMDARSFREVYVPEHLCPPAVREQRFADMPSFARWRTGR